MSQHHRDPPTQIMSREVVAAGFIIFRRIQSQIEYLLMKHSYGEHWTPPKGHVDPGETELETAYRETLEEAGLQKDSFKIVEGCKQTLHYNVRGRPKRVEYWVAELRDPQTPIILSHEHEGYQWLDLDNAIKVAHFSEMEKALRNVHQLLQKL